MIAFGALVPMLLTWTWCAASEEVVNTTSLVVATSVENVSAVPAALLPLDEPVSLEYNVSGSEEVWSADPKGAPLTQIIVVRDRASAFATEPDVTEDTNEEVSNVSGNQYSLLALLRRKPADSSFQADKANASSQTTAAGGVVRIIIIAKKTGPAVDVIATEASTYDPRTYDVPAAAVPARTASEPAADCKSPRRAHKRRRPSLQVYDRARSASSRTPVPRERSPSRAALRKVKVVLSRTNRTSVTPRPGSVAEGLTLRERGCVPLETSPAVQDRATCPFRFITSFDRRRLPRLLTSVRCMCPGSPCSTRSGFRCLEISKPVSLMRRVGRTYVDQLEEMPVACVCAYVGHKVRDRQLLHDSFHGSRGF
ncbi:hypothetical protein HPB48_001382 [Haemaphysalis longicornis]|uniref:Uncharacterized protein n=1 Tax=Haemaphysalis longicornis TaxID=44386 RepID=A0A9J6FHZ9_HAELO|nr:hypothetical protein HPB48_001382 [Haemaphysalis longicornis]